MPNTDHFDGQIGDLKRRIARANPEERQLLRPHVDQMMQTMRRKGTVVPRQLQALHNTLLEEAIEDQFDNLPV